MRSGGLAVVIVIDNRVGRIDAARDPCALWREVSWGVEGTEPPRQPCGRPGSERRRSPGATVDGGLWACRSCHIGGLDLRVCRNAAGVDSLYRSKAASSRGRIILLTTRRTRGCSLRPGAATYDRTGM